MSNNLLLKILKQFLKEYIFIFLTATIFLFTITSKTFSEENIFVINDVKVEGQIDLNFSRDKYINKAFLISFENLTQKILLERDISKIKNIKIKEIKSLINSFQIVEEKLTKEEYKGSFKILYSDYKVKKFLAKKNISFSQPERLSVIFYPILFIDGEFKNFDENLFYKIWPEIKTENEIINFILPLEDLDDVSEIIKNKDKIEDVNISKLVSKYDIKNYVFALFDHQKEKLNVYLKISFNNNLISKNILYNIKNINDLKELNLISADLKLKITDIWKEENLINLLMPLSINLKFQHKNIKNLDLLRNKLKKISIIDNYVLEEFNTYNSIFKIYYFGNPKKLKSELFKFGYKLVNVKGYWELYLDE